MKDVQQSFAQQGLVRPRQGRVLGGVCVGLGRRFGIAPWTARFLFVLLLMVIPGSQILIYPILWFLMPSADTVRGQPPQDPPVPAAGPSGGDAGSVSCGLRAAGFELGRCRDILVCRDRLASTCR